MSEDTRFAFDYDSLHQQDKPTLKDDNPISLAIRKIMNQLSRVGMIQSASMEFHDFTEFSQLSTLVGPGAKVLINTGMILQYQSPRQLASILAHGIGHVIGDHSAEFATAHIFAGFLPHWDGRYKDIRGLSTVKEVEADHIGLLILADAGFDPQSCLDFMSDGIVRDAQLKKKKGVQLVPEELSGHPSWETRLAAMKALPPKAKSIFHRTRNSRPLGRDIMEWREIQALAKQLHSELANSRAV